MLYNNNTSAIINTADNCFTAAVEKQKFVYVLNRDASNKLAISSPLEAHKSHNITFSIAGLDVAYDNPIFAAIELDYSEADNDSTGAALTQATKVYIPIAPVRCLLTFI